MEKLIPAPSLIVLIGPSGSGKSTWATENFHSTEIVSSDELRGRLGSGPADLSASDAAFSILDTIVAERTKRATTTVIDTLGLDEKRLQGWVGTAHEFGIAAHAVIFETPLDICLERNSGRDDPLPQQTIRKQHRKMADVAGTLGTFGFAAVHRPEQPIRVVAPQMAVKPLSENQIEGKHRFGLMISRFAWPDDTPFAETLVTIAQDAEAAGFTDIWLMDHFRQIHQVGRPWEDIPEVYAALSFLAASTSSIRLGALVTGITHRHPMVLGQALATLDVLSGGRAICGLGIGWDSDEHASYGIPMPPVGERYELLSESIDALRLLWGKGTPEFAGDHIRATSLACYPRPVQDPIPILIGGSGERKTLRLVAEKADAANVFGTPERVAHKVSVLRSHCDELGRDPDEIEVTHLVNVMAAAGQGDLRSRVARAKQPRQTFEDYAARNNAGLIGDQIVLFEQYREAGATHSIVAMPDVHIAGAVSSFAPVIAELG